jgi:hypothetical protein
VNANEQPPASVKRSGCRDHDGLPEQSARCGPGKVTTREDQFPDFLVAKAWGTGFEPLTSTFLLTNSLDALVSWASTGPVAADDESPTGDGSVGL